MAQQTGRAYVFDAKVCFVVFFRLAIVFFTIVLSTKFGVLFALILAAVGLATVQEMAVDCTFGSLVQTLQLAVKER